MVFHPFLPKLCRRIAYRYAPSGLVRLLVPLDIDAETDYTIMVFISSENKVYERYEITIGRFDLKVNFDPIFVEIFQVGFMFILIQENDVLMHFAVGGEFQAATRSIVVQYADDSNRTWC